MICFEFHITPRFKIVRNSCYPLCFGCSFVIFHTKRQRELEFDARLKTVQGGVDHINDIIEFKRPHNLQNGEPLVYSNNGNLSLGVGTYLGSNTVQNKTLINGATYYPQVVGVSSVLLV